MTGIEYSLFLVQEPVLYVIKKVHRQSPEKGTKKIIIINRILS